MAKGNLSNGGWRGGGKKKPMQIEPSMHYDSKKDKWWLNLFLEEIRDKLEERTLKTLKTKGISN